MLPLRRSQRQQATQYDANGRDYLAAELNYTIQELEAWLALPKVQPHLQSWYELCVAGRRRYKEALAWIDAVDSIDSGESGYFYDEDGLQEDLLLECLGEGNVKDGNDSEFRIEKVQTTRWSTQKMWSRAVWRIVQDNCGPNQLFEEAVVKHPAAAYALTIDILSIAYHSIVFRGTTSFWHTIMLNESEGLPSSPSSMSRELALDQQAEWETGDEDASQIDIAMTECPDSEKQDDDSNFELPQTPKRARKVTRVSTPSAPRKKRPANRQHVHTHEWLQGLPKYHSEFEDPGTEEEQQRRLLMVMDEEKC